MRYNGLQSFVDHLEQIDELSRISVFVDPQLEIAEIADRMVKHEGKALLFEKTGTDFPVLINAFASDRRLAAALGQQNLDDLSVSVAKLFSMADDAAVGSNIFNKIGLLLRLKQLSALVPKKQKGRGACQQIIMDEPLLTLLPVLKCWPYDGGRFFTLPLVHTVHPETGKPNLGMYRMQVYNDTETGMHWHIHKDGASHFNRYKALKKKMPVTVTLGGDPVYTYAATAPLPEGIDEYLLAGFLRKKKVKLVQCITNELWIPNDVDFVIEGYVDPKEQLRTEGPFGDHTGFYSLEDPYPVFHVTAITHRKNAVFPATVVGIPPQEDLWLGKATERIFTMPLKKSVVPEMIDMVMPKEGVFHNIVVVSIKNRYPGQPEKVANALWGAGQMMFNKILVIVNEDIDIRDHTQIANLFSSHYDAQSSIIFSKGPLDILDHAADKAAYGSKAAIDLTVKRQEATGKIGVHAATQHALLQITAVKNINTALAEKQVPVLLVAVSKTEAETISKLHQEVAGLLKQSGCKIVLYFDADIPLEDISALIWLTAGNIDPWRDYYPVSIGDSCIGGVDATRKGSAADVFNRPWPNVVVMDEHTIDKVDAMWHTLGLGENPGSPGRKYLAYAKGDGAVITNGGKN
ncbi:MAG: menaquinone biosynthesis decarboxylase [Bacteroidales bacterium]|nr:menaquinone biosynthesis decarboxylase [Bacteroidales bacterium]